MISQSLWRSLASHCYQAKCESNHSPSLDGVMSTAPRSIHLGAVYTVTTGTEQLLAPKLLAEHIKGRGGQLTVYRLLDMHLKYAVHLRPKTLRMLGQFTIMYLNKLGVDSSGPSKRLSAPTQLVSFFMPKDNFIRQ